MAVLALLKPGDSPANGDDFFAPAHAAAADLVYFGVIKDSFGHALDGAVITVTAGSVGLSMPFANDVIGHYRSPDIGAAIRQLGGKAEANDIRIACRVPGYRQAKSTPVRARARGAVEVDFVMEKLIAPADSLLSPAHRAAGPTADGRASP